MFAVILGRDLNVGTNGILNVETDKGNVEFFRVREIHRQRSGGSYPVVDCDVHDASGTREIKLAKSRPVARSVEIDVTTDKGLTVALRQDGSVVIKVEVLSKEQLSQWVADRQSRPLRPEVQERFMANMPEESRQHLGDHKPPPLPPEVKTMIDRCDGALRLTGDFRAGPYHVVADQDGYNVEGRIIASGNIRCGTGPIRLRRDGFSM